MKGLTNRILVLLVVAATVTFLLVLRKHPEEAEHRFPRPRGPAKAPVFGAGPEAEISRSRPKGAFSSKPSAKRTRAVRHLPRKSLVLMSDGSMQSKGRLGGGDVIAEIYEGAPKAAVDRLREILLSGSNEYAEFTKSEEYPPEVYEKIRQMFPGELGGVLAYFAERETKLDADVRPTPALDWRDDDEYVVMYIGSTGEIPVAETKFGTVWVNRHCGAITPADFAVWLAHRLAAVDENLRLPELPPKGYKDWESWVRGHVTEEHAKQLENEGLLPRRFTQ